MYIYQKLYFDTINLHDKRASERTRPVPSNSSCLTVFRARSQEPIVSVH